MTNTERTERIMTTARDMDGPYTLSAYDVEDVVEAYMECAEWANDGEAPWHNQTQAEVRADVEDFVGLLEAEEIDWQGRMTLTQFGHDFYLTRNRHGAGFWDRGLGTLGDALTKWAHTYGETS